MSCKLVFRLVFSISLSGFFFSLPSVAQVNDAGLWASVNFEFKVSKKLSAGISEELRFNENISELGAALTDIGLKYKLSKRWQVAGNYRFTQRHRIDNYYSFRHRFYIDLKYSKKVKALEVSWRGRIQDQYNNINRAPDGGVPEFYLRNKFALAWDLKKAFTPYVSVELFTPLNYPRFTFLDNIRYAAGVEYTVTKKHKFDFYYMIHNEMNVSNPFTYFVIGTGYFYKL
jgi:hypothetical protein